MAVKLIDGDTTHELLRLGIVNDRNMLSASALVNPGYNGVVILAHMAFIDAGADYITTSNKMVTPGVGFNLQEMEELTRLSGTLAKKAQGMAAANKRDVKILGRLPPLMPSYRADRTLGEAKCDDLYNLICKSLDEFVDAFLASPMSSFEEAKFALDAAKRFQKPIFIGLALNHAGDLRSGEALTEVLKKLVDHALDSTTSTPQQQQQQQQDDQGEHVKAHGLQAILFSCSQPEDITKALQKVHNDNQLRSLVKHHDIQLGALGNQVSPTSRAGELAEELLPGAVTMHSPVELQIYAEFARKWIQLGAKLVGGCCGIGPKHLLMIHDVLELDHQTQP